MQKVIITGVSGFIGRVLATALIRQGFNVVGLSRNPNNSQELTNSGIRLFRWNGTCPDTWFEEVDGSLAIINLAGENIATKKWSQSQQDRIVESRIKAIHAVQDAISLADNKPELLIQASAIGYYGTKTTAFVDERQSSGTGFLASVCKDIEAEVNKTEDTRVVIARFGLVLDTTGGALEKITAPMKYGICGIPGNGNNMVSWIHMNDLVNGIIHIIKKKGSENRVYNCTSPSPITLKELVRKVAGKKRTLFCMPIPVPVLAVSMGRKMVTETLVASQSVIPQALLSEGFRFEYPDIKTAIAGLFT